MANIQENIQNFNDELLELILNCKLSPAQTYIKFYKAVSPRIELIKANGGGLELQDVDSIVNDLFVHYALATISYNESLELISAYMVKRLGLVSGLLRGELALIEPFVAVVIGSNDRAAILDTLFDAYTLYNRQVMQAIAKARGIKL